MIIFAPHIHTGGGEVLLKSILENIDFNCTVFVDHRFVLPLNLKKNNLNYIKLKSGLFYRLFAEFELSRLAKKEQNVFCFSNLPPLFKLNANVTVFFQNNILFDEFKNFKFSVATKIKHSIERLWIAKFVKNADRVIVQTFVVKKYFFKNFKFDKIVVAPFFDFNDTMATQAINKTIDFIYIASSDPHKNHLNLFKAWSILASENIRPTLAIAIPANGNIVYTEMLKLIDNGLRIINYKNQTHLNILQLYQSARCLIFTSYTESLGLPVIEAIKSGLDLISSNLDYIYEIVEKPLLSFDPNSPELIAQAVKDYLILDQAQIQKPILKIKILTSKEFIQKFLIQTEIL